MTKSLLSSLKGENLSRKQVRACACAWACMRHGSIPYAFCCRFSPLSCGLGASLLSAGLLSAGRRCHGNVGRLMAGLGSGDVSDVILFTRQSDGGLGCNICTAAGAARERIQRKKTVLLHWNYNYSFAGSYVWRTFSPCSLGRAGAPLQPQRRWWRTAIRRINSH